MPERPKELYVTGVEYPEGYDWKADSDYGYVACTVFLMKDGERIVELDVDDRDMVASDADMHRCFGGHLYTDYSTESETVIKKDGDEMFRYPDRELICGFQVIDDDVYRMDGVKRDTQKMRLLLRSLARNESTAASNKTLARDIRGTDDEDIDAATVASYLDIFKRLFITDNQPPFAAGIRSSVRVKQAEKRHFSDPSLACALLKATPAGLLGDLETLGFLFEAMCERDLRIYAESFGANLYHYQDYKDNEIDAVVELPDGEWCAFEIKLGANQIDAAAGNLLQIKKQFENDPKGKPPAVLCVLCGLSNAAYKRPDGVFVVPVTALKD